MMIITQYNFTSCILRLCLQFLTTMNPHLLLAHCQLLTYKIIGLAPIRLNQSTSISTSKENTWFIFSLFRAIFRYDFMIIIAIISLNIFRMWSGVGNNLEKSRITMILLGGLEYGFMWTGVIILLTYYTKQKFIKNLVKRFITLKFNSSNPINIYYSNNAKWRSCFFFFNELITSACSSIFDGLLEEKLTINWIGGELCYSIVILFVTQYALILNVIRDRFVAVNEELMTIIVKYENKERTSAILRNQLILCNAKDILLIKLIRNYENLMEICGEISDFFSFPIFLAIAIATYSIIVNTYWSMVTLVLSVWQHNMLYTNIAAISWFVNTFFPVVALTTSVTGINTEVGTFI